jgi:hypothetical protein
MYVQVARKIYLENREELKLAAGDGNDSVGIPIALAGIALGNGWIDARGEAPLPLIMRIGMENAGQFTQRDNCMRNGSIASSRIQPIEDIASPVTTKRRREPAPFHNARRLFHDDEHSNGGGEGSWCESLGTEHLRRDNAWGSLVSILPGCW